MSSLSHQEYRENIIHYNNKDIELKLLFHKYCEKINSIPTVSNEVKEYNTTNLKGIILSYCEYNKIDFDQTFLILIYPNSTPTPDPYFMYLAYLLSSIEEYEINEYLAHHFLNYTYNQQDFLGRIINYVIEQTQRVMPINNYSLREKIMLWATRKKAQLNTLINDNLLPENSKIVSAEKGIKDDLVIEKKTLYYWEKDIKKLEHLYQILLEEKMIEPNENFIKSFSEYIAKTKNSTIWNRTETSLFALLYLLYDKEPYYKQEILGQIASKLFIVKGKKSNLISAKENFRVFMKRVEDLEYLQKKHSSILSIYQKI